MSRLVIYGAGGFALQIWDMIPGDAVIADDNRTGDFHGLPIISPSELRASDRICIAVGNPRIRRLLAERYSAHAMVGLKDRTARTSEAATVGEAAILCHDTLIEASARIGRHFHGNIYSYVAHECVIGDFVTFAPRVSCNGNVHIGDGAYIGTGAILRQGNPATPLVIGAGAVVGMGAVVTKDVPAGTTVIGNPARPMPSKAV